MRMVHYILDENGEPKCIGSGTEDMLRWVKCFEDEKRIVKQEYIGPYQVSTVFLGLDHNFRPEGPPVLWETMVFGGELHGECTRCSGSREQALAMHERMVKRVKE